MGFVRLKGLAQKANGTNISYLSEKSGYSFIRDGNDLVIPEDDDQLVNGPPPVLKTEAKPLFFSKGYQNIADIYIDKYLIPSLENLISLDKKILIPDYYGLLSNLEAHKLEFFFSKTPSETKTALLGKLLPFMHNEMKSKAVFPITCDVKYQQSIISIYRLVAGITTFGVDKMAQRYEEEKLYSGLMPTPVSISTYPEALLFFAPYAVTLPIGKVCSHLHFMNDNLWFFPNLATRNVFELLATNHNPVQVENITDFLNLYDLKSYGSRNYFSECIKGVNKLMSNVNNPLKYVSENGDLDSISALKAQSSIHLMFSDMVAINFSNNKNTKLRHAFAFLDKLANFVVAFQHIEDRQRGSAEAKSFEAFFSHEFGHKLASMLKHHLKPVYDKLGICLSKAVLSLFERFEHGDSGNNNLLRSIRNTQHGPYLGKNQFEQVFFSDYKIPSEIVYFPILIMWGLMLDFDGFIALFNQPD